MEQGKSKNPDVLCQSQGMPWDGKFLELHIYPRAASNWQGHLYQGASTARLPPASGKAGNQTRPQAFSPPHSDCPSPSPGSRLWQRGLVGRALG